jgi:hypothetical protein
VPDEGSVWDDGPDYPDLWPAPSGDSASAPDLSDPSDQTPTSPSPVDLDAVEPATEMVAARAAVGGDDGRREWWRGRFLGLAAWIWLTALGVLLTVLVLVVTTADGDDPELVDATGPNASGPAMTTPPTVRPSGTVATGTLPEVAPPDSLPVVTAPGTVAPVPSSTDAPATAPPTTAAPATATPTTTTAPPGDGPVVTIDGRVAPCDFGAQCLIAGFTIDGFDSQPTEFVCEFGDGSRYPFRFDSQGVERACATGNPDGSITIEVDGVRSETFRRP